MTSVPLPPLLIDKTDHALISRVLRMRCVLQLCVLVFLGLSFVANSSNASGKNSSVPCLALVQSDLDTFRAHVGKWVGRIEQDSLSPELPGELESLPRVMNYAIEAGGKRIRPALVINIWQILSSHQADPAPIKTLYVVFEKLHKASLAADDGAGMDNSPLRNGKPSVARQFGEGPAQCGAFGLIFCGMRDLLWDHSLVKDFGNDSVRRVTGYLNDMALKITQGQDIDLRNQSLSLEDLVHMHKLKTASAFQGALVSPAMLFRRIPPRLLELLDQVGELSGIAYQIMDDIGDVTKSEAETGKPNGIDAKNSRKTFMTHFKTVEEAQKQVKLRTDQARMHIAELQQIHPNSDWVVLRGFMDWIDQEAGINPR